MLMPYPSLSDPVIIIEIIKITLLKSHSLQVSLRVAFIICSMLRCSVGYFYSDCTYDHKESDLIFQADHPQLRSLVRFPQRQIWVVGWFTCWFTCCNKSTMKLKDCCTWKNSELKHLCWCVNKTVVWTICIILCFRLVLHSPTVCSLFLWLSVIFLYFVFRKGQTLVRQCRSVL